MKSRPYTVCVVLALAAVALWFVRPAGKNPEMSRTTSTGTASQMTAGSAIAPAREPDAPLSAVVTATVGSTPTSAGSVTAAHGPTVTHNPLPNGDGSNPLPDQAAQTDVGRARHMVSDYHTLMGENPVGTNAEIMKQLMGGNPHQAILGPPDGMTLNSQGELIDQWGTPLFFHQLSRDKMEVRSAGPDKIMWTADDIVTR